MDEIMKAEEKQRRVDTVMALIAGCVVLLVIWLAIIIF